jgi:tyrosyl-tRNA synthetase
MKEELEWRGLLHNHSNGLFEDSGVDTVYLGIDPTAASLHVGSLLPIMCLNRFMERGYNGIVLIGGGTAMVGDPSGKRNERPILSLEAIQSNIDAIKLQVERLAPKAKVLNNMDWLQEMSFMGFLRSVGKHFSVNYMRGKDSVKLREEDGMSFTEFSYMLLQAYDFLHLHEHHGCKLQIGGSDQWGNIVCGIDLIKKNNGTAHGLTIPLLTTSNGEKFGKSVDGNVWLDPNLTSPYRFHQFWLNTTDDDVIKHLKFFTNLSEQNINELEEAMRMDPSQRTPQQALANAITTLVHGEQEAAKANSMRKLLFGGHDELRSLSAGEINGLFDSKVRYRHAQLSGQSNLTDILWSLNIYDSKSEIKRAVKEGSLSINGDRVNEAAAIIDASSLIHNKYIVVRKGKKNHVLIEFA